MFFEERVKDRKKLLEKIGSACHTTKENSWGLYMGSVTYLMEFEILKAREKGVRGFDDPAFW